MPSAAVRSLLFAVLGGFSLASAQVPPTKASTLPRTEPGLERAVKWKWWVMPSNEKDWGLALPEAPPPPPVSPVTPPSPGALAHPQNPAARPDFYEVKRGDALILIGKRFGLTVDQLKSSNGLTDNLIRAGQVLKIPTPQEVAALAPAPTPTPSQAPQKSAAVAAKRDSAAELAKRGSDLLAMQIFLDRELFSVGPIDGKHGLVFDRAAQLYQSLHPDVATPEAFAQKARASIADAFATYALRAEDFRFIAPPKAERPDPKAPANPAHKGKAKPPAPSTKTPPPTYEDMTTTTMLAYRSPWEFVAERFHCDEAYLRSLNEKIKSVPAAGTEFKVPNVIPFEIEHLFESPLQPLPDSMRPMTASVVNLSQLEIFRSGTLVASMPLSAARPGLKGKGTWTVLNAIPRPRLATIQEMRDPVKYTPPPFGAPNQEGPPPPKPVLSSEQYLPAGPNNPAGVIWIQLAKEKASEPLPYGLHGTSIPGQMATQESIGGFRLTNWDIARAVRLLPVGTPIEWK